MIGTYIGFLANWLTEVSLFRKNLNVLPKTLLLNQFKSDDDEMMVGNFYGVKARLVWVSETKKRGKKYVVWKKMSSRFSAS